VHCECEVSNPSMTLIVSLTEAFIHPHHNPQNHSFLVTLLLACSNFMGEIKPARIILFMSVTPTYKCSHNAAIISISLIM